MTLDGEGDRHAGVLQAGHHLPHRVVHGRHHAQVGLPGQGSAVQWWSVCNVDRVPALRPPLPGLPLDGSSPEGQ
jgi:hypothetical protein